MSLGNVLPSKVFDKPRSAGRAGALDIHIPLMAALGQNATGGQLYERLSIALADQNQKDKGWTSFVKTMNDKIVNQKVASEYIASIGIPGNKYLDQGSRGRIEPESKYFAQREDALKWAGEYRDVVDDGSKTPWREGKSGVDSEKSPQGWRAYRRGTPTYNYVIWDQKVLDRVALLE